jgi:hypothetical protein
MLKALDDLVESRIREAQDRGEFDRLPGAGRPLPDEDLAGVPHELRVAYRVLRNAGCLPPEVDALRDLDAAIVRIAADTPADGAVDRPAAHRRLLALTLALEARGLGRAATALLEHRAALLHRLGERTGPGADDPGRPETDR